MPQQGTIIRVLIASPSDCEKERSLVPDVLYAWNAANSFRRAVILEPVKWETHSYPEFGDRPQGILNRQLVENCDILIGTFWTRLGTNTGKSDSGTAEEIDEFRRTGKHVLLYFSSAPIQPDSIDLDQYQALKEYKSRLSNNCIFSSYDDLIKLRELLNIHLVQAIDKLLESATESIRENDSSSDPGMNREFCKQYTTFIKRLEIEWACERDSSPRNLNTGKSIISKALDSILDFRSSFNHDIEGFTNTLDEASKNIRQLQRHELYGDGGRSFRDFWNQGNIIIERLKSISDLLEGNRQ